jgi:hypothetical protein
MLITSWGRIAHQFQISNGSAAYIYYFYSLLLQR